MQTYSPLSLAFLGDSVYDLLARETLLREANRPARKLHAESTRRVNAREQACAAQKIAPLLSSEEAAVLRRGQNAKPRHAPGSCTREEYALATGLEALFGWLWLAGHFARARELFMLVWNA
ncbi:MAG: ribonuclease III [Oscillospiraceae bacterium]|nr:ribonuclease III [Oscillospiraceae bacterium]